MTARFGGEVHHVRSGGYFSICNLCVINKLRTGDENRHSGNAHKCPEDKNRPACRGDGSEIAYTRVANNQNAIQRQAVERRRYHIRWS